MNYKEKSCFKECNIYIDLLCEIISLEIILFFITVRGNYVKKFN